MKNGYGACDNQTNAAAFMGLPSEFGYMNHMRDSDGSGVIYVGKGSKMFKVMYIFTRDHLSITVPREGYDFAKLYKREEQPVTEQVMEILRQNCNLRHAVFRAPEYDRHSQSITYTDVEIMQHFHISVSYKEISFTAAFLHCNRIAAEVTAHDGRVYDLTFEIEGPLLVIRDPIDDNKLSHHFNEVPSVVDILKACSEAFKSDLYRVAICSQQTG